MEDISFACLLGMTSKNSRIMRPQRKTPQLTPVIMVIRLNLYSPMVQLSYQTSRRCYRIRLGRSFHVSTALHFISAYTSCRRIHRMNHPTGMSSTISPTMGMTRRRRGRSVSIGRPNLSVAPESHPTLLRTLKQYGRGRGCFAASAQPGAREY